MAATIDHCRWLAAVLVAAAHIRTLIFPDAWQVGRLGIPGTLFYFATLFGNQAVVVFFVISGFLVGGNTQNRIRANAFSVRLYAIDRTTRLYIVLLPAIAMTVLLAHLGLSTSCPQSDTFWDSIQNALLMQNFISKPLCNNHPLWSLSSEGFFYILGPAALMTFSKKNIGSAFVTVLCLVLAIASWNGTYSSPAFGALLWGLGLIPWHIQFRVRPAIAFLPFLGLLIVSRIGYFKTEFLQDLLLALSFTFFLCSEFSAEKLADRKATIGTRLAAFSYSLYLVHMPLAQAFSSMRHTKVDPHKSSSYVIYFAIFSAIVLVAFVFGILFERQTGAVRRLISGEDADHDGKSRTRFRA